MSNSVFTKGKTAMKTNKAAAAIEKEILALRAQQVAKVYELLGLVGLTVEDLQAHAPKRGRKAATTAPTAASKPTAKAKAASAADEPAKARKKIEPKYSNPKTGETWTGMGRAPLWIRDAKDRTRFLIAK